MAEEQTKEVSPELVQSVADANFKNRADAPAFYAAMMLRDAVAHSKTIDKISESILAKQLEAIATVDPVEATGVKELLTGNALAEKITALGTAISGLQAILKGAQTTPPPTA